VLQFQNRKLSERIEQRRRAEEDLRKRIEQLEQRQTTDDDVLCIVNRYWNQVSTVQITSGSDLNHVAFQLDRLMVIMSLLS